MTVTDWGEPAAAAADRIARHLLRPPSTRVLDTGPRSPRWWDQSLSKGAAGVAVLHGVRARSGFAAPEVAHGWLRRATADELSAAPGCGLWFGAPAVAFALESAAPGHYPRAAAALHETVERLVAHRIARADARLRATQRPRRSEFDLVRGLTGLGAHLLVRDPHGRTLRDVLAYLVRLTEPVDAPDAAGRDVPGWWTVDEPARAGRARRHGFSDQGMAHGIAGPLALLAVAQTRGITVTGQVEAIRRICRWLNACARDTGDGRWWPAYVTLSDIRESSSDERPGRPSWCYGTPGIARALQLAAIALDDPARQAEAENAVLGAASNPRQLGMLSDPYVCHGWAGLLATVSVAARDATTPALSQLIPGLVDALVAHEPVIDGPTGLVDGAAGVALTLHSVAHQAFGSWTSCLLLG